MKNYDVAKEIAFNARNVILWQYDNAPNFNALIAMKQNFYDDAVSDFWERWIDDVLNIQTANEFGLTLWSFLLNLERPLYTNADGELVPIPTESYRFLLNAKLYKNSHAPTFSNVNTFIRQIFFNHPDNKSYVQDNLNMSITYILDFFPTAEEEIVLQLNDFLPRPSGVKIASIIPIPPQETFGFEGSGLKPFNNGVFVVDSIGVK
jgi:hypothetical protein